MMATRYRKITVVAVLMGLIVFSFTGVIMFRPSAVVDKMSKPFTVVSVVVTSNKSRHPPTWSGTSNSSQIEYLITDAAGVGYPYQGAPSVLSSTNATLSAKEARTSTFGNGSPEARKGHLLGTTASAVEEYLEKIRRAFDRKRDHCSSKKSPGDNGVKKKIKLDIALDCLQMTTPGLNKTLTYPDDADAHYYEIRQAMAPWAQHRNHQMNRYLGYEGPWIENYWISELESLYDSSGNCLSDHYGPFIPLFIPWLDHWLERSNSKIGSFPEDMVAALLSVLRHDVPYITLAQNDEGFPAGDARLEMARFPNLLVLSAGGYGHVPVPLFAGPLEPLECHNISRRNFTFNYVGSLWHAPRRLRMHMDHRMKQLAEMHNFTYKQHHGHVWKKIMCRSKFSLTPRGYGRTAFHVMEALQMGLIPVYVYDKVPWLPYGDWFREFGFSTSLDGLKQLVEQLLNMSSGELFAREQKILHYRDQFFTLKGAVQQIHAFMVGGTNTRLKCQPLPSQVRMD